MTSARPTDKAGKALHPIRCAVDALVTDGERFAADPPLDHIVAVGAHQTFPGEWAVSYFEYVPSLEEDGIAVPETPLSSAARVIKRAAPSCQKVTVELRKKSPSGWEGDLGYSAPREGFEAVRRTREGFIWRYEFPS